MEDGGNNTQSSCYTIFAQQSTFKLGINIMTHQRVPITLLLLVLLSSCVPAGTISPTQTAIPITSTATPTLSPSATPTLTLTPTPTLPPMTDFMDGMAYFPAGYGGDHRPESEWIMKNVVLATGANWIHIIDWCYQDSIRKTDVYCNPNEPLPEEDYIHLVKLAHSLGMRVMSGRGIRCCQEDPEGYWAGDIGKAYDEKQWAAWFESYGEMVLQYAELAEKTETDYFMIAGELESTTHREKEWRELIAKVREVYHGKVSMAYSEESSLHEVQFWDVLDAIGVHPYYLDLPDVIDPTVAQLEAAFQPHADKLEALSKKWSRPILIDDIGFFSIHTQTQNYNNNNLPNPIDLQEQTDLYQAVFDMFYGKPWVIGIFCNAISGASNPAEPWNVFLSFINKPAENMIRSFYGAPPFSTPTPVTPPDPNLNTTEVIYGDSLNLSWSNYPPEGDPANIQFDQSEMAVTGDAIKVNLNKFWSLDLTRDDVSWNKYQWLEFDVYAEPKNFPKGSSFGVTLRDTSYYPSLFSVELIQSQFIEGGILQPGVWQHVQIPLDVFGPMLSRYITINISRSGIGENKPLTLYVDNILLTGK